MEKDQRHFLFITLLNAGPFVKYFHSCWIQRWKNFENRQIFGKVINGKYRWFFDSQCSFISSSDNTLWRWLLMSINKYCYRYCSSTLMTLKKSLSLSVSTIFFTVVLAISILNPFILPLVSTRITMSFGDAAAWMYLYTVSVTVKVKFSYTHYRALNPHLIPVYRQSARWWLFKSSPGGRLPLLSARLLSQPKNVTILRSVPSYIDWWQRHTGVKNLPKVVTQLCSGGNWTHEVLNESPTP